MSNKLPFPGLNEDLSPVSFEPGEADIASNVDMTSRPGAIRKRAGTSEFLDAAGGRAFSSTKICQAAAITMYDGGVYLFVKGATAGAASLKFVKLFPALGNWTQVPSPTGTSPSWTADTGEFRSINGCMYYFNPAGVIWFNGTTSYYAGIDPPAGTWSLTANGDGQLDGVYLYRVTAYDSGRNCRSNATQAFPITAYDNVGIECPQSGKTLITVAKNTAAKVAGDKVTHAELWRAHQVVVADDGTREYYAYPMAFYLVSRAAWDGAAALSFYDGYNEASLDGAEVAPYTDNNRPPPCTFAAVHNNRLVCLVYTGDLYWSQYGRLEQFPYINPPDSGLYRGLTGQRVENRSRANLFDGPVLAMDQAGGQLLAFTATATYRVLGGESLVVEPVDVPYGCLAHAASAPVPGGGLFVLGKGGLVYWPGGRAVSDNRFGTIITGSNYAYLANGCVGYSGHDNAVIAAVPAGTATLANTAYVLGLKDGALAKWTFAWADGTNRGISKIVNVNLPNAAEYTLFCCSDGRIYKYPDTNQDAGVSFAAQYRGYFSQDFFTRANKPVRLDVACGTISDTVKVKLLGLSHPSATVDYGYSELTATQSNTTQALVGQTQGRFGRMMRLDIASDAADATWEILGVYAELERDDTA